MRLLSLYISSRHYLAGCFASLVIPSGTNAGLDMTLIMWLFSLIAAGVGPPSQLIDYQNETTTRHWGI